MILGDNLDAFVGQSNSRSPGALKLLLRVLFNGAEFIEFIAKAAAVSHDDFMFTQNAAKNLSFPLVWLCFIARNTGKFFQQLLRTLSFRNHFAKSFGVYDRVEYKRQFCLRGVKHIFMNRIVFEYACAGVRIGNEFAAMIRRDDGCSRDVGQDSLSAAEKFREEIRLDKSFRYQNVGVQQHFHLRLFPRRNGR